MKRKVVIIGAFILIIGFVIGCPAPSGPPAYRDPGVTPVIEITEDMDEMEKILIGELNLNRENLWPADKEARASILTALAIYKSGRADVDLPKKEEQ